MKSEKKFYWTCIGVAMILLAAWHFNGCGGGGGGGGTPTPSASSDTGSTAVKSGTDGTPSDITATTESRAASVTVPQGTLLYDENGNPVTGNDIQMTMTNYPCKDCSDCSDCKNSKDCDKKCISGNSSDAAAAFQTLYFAVSIKIKKGNTFVTQFKDKSGKGKPLKLKVKVKNAADGQTIKFYWFNGTIWIEQGDVTVNNGQVEIELTHLTMFGSGVFNSGTTGTGGTGTGSQGGTGKNF